MKNIFIILVVCFVLSSCRTAATVPQFDLCAEKQMVADTWKMKIKEIGDSATPPTEKDVGSLVKPLGKNFKLDDARCQGYTQQIRDASKKVIRNRAVDITSTLMKICSRRIDQETADVSLMAAMQEERTGAKEALIVLHEPTIECLAD